MLKTFELSAHVGRLAVVLTSILILAACGSSDNPSTPDNPPQSTVIGVSGSVTKGPVSSATINVYAVDANGQKTGSPIATTTTDSTGKYTLNLTDFSGVYIVEATGGSYVDEATGVNKEIPSDAPLRAVSSIDSTGTSTTVTATVTPLTEIAVRVAEQKQGGLTADNVQTSNDEIGALFFGDTEGAGNKLLTTSPADITSEDSTTSSDDEKTYGLMLGAISKIQSNVGSLDTALASIANDISADGNLSDTSAELITATTDVINGATNNSGVTSATTVSNILTAAASGSGTQVTQSSDADITRFAFGDTLSTTIDAGAHTIAVLQPSGTDLSGLSDPTIVVSLGGTVAAQGSEDFTNNVVYTVTAQDGTTVDWTVTVTAAASTASTAANITSSVSNLITSMLINKNQHAVVGGVASLDDLASLDQVADPTDIFGISDGASVALVSGSYQLGTAKYMITAEDGTTTNEWSVLFRVNDPQQQPAFSIANGNLSLLVNSAPVQLQTSGGISTAARTFASSNTAVVTVDDQGTLTVVGPGSATITASKDRLVTRVVEYLSASTSIDVAVEKLEQTMLQFSSDAISVALSSAASNDLTGGNGSGALSFTSSDESVATVGADGTITVLAVGATTITADKAGDNTYLASNTASYVLTVTEDPTTTTPTCVLDQSKWDECQID